MAVVVLLVAVVVNSVFLLDVFVIVMNLCVVFIVFVVVCRVLSVFLIVLIDESFVLKVFFCCWSFMIGCRSIVMSCEMRVLVSMFVIRLLVRM